MSNHPAIAAAYVEFARAAEGRSPLYVEIASGVANDDALLSRIAVLPLEKRQPNLLLAAVKYLHGTAGDWRHFRALALDGWDELEKVIRSRRTQTNEPARLATLLPLFAQLPQPLALLEVGASAGLCLFPDKYGYRYGDHFVLPAEPNPDAPVFCCEANQATPLPVGNVEVAWRAGLDLNPLDVSNSNDRRWLKALVWPGEGAREALLDKAVAVARKTLPRIVKGDLTRDLPSLAATAPKGATLAVFHSAVLDYVGEPAGRLAFREAVKAIPARWVSNEGASVFDGGIKRSWPVGSYFILMLDGKPVAKTESHGASIEWFDGVRV